MRKKRVVLCSYSFGTGNGIAHVDAELLAGIDAGQFDVSLFVLRADFQPGRLETYGQSTHVSLADAFALLCGELRTADILQVNGAFDPVACNAAAVAGVPAVIEVMHQVETGGMHEGIDAVFCVSDLVRSVQAHPNAVTIRNGIDTGRFSFKPGRRNPETVTVIQVANAAKVLHCELGDIAAQLEDPRIRTLMVGSRKPVGATPSLGTVTDMPRVYHDADLLFLVEKQAAFGLVFAEAMACGVLPIVSGNSGAVEFVRSGGTGWAVDPALPGNAAAILRKAADTVATPEFETRQRAARELIVKQFDKKRMLADYQALYAELGSRPRRPLGRRAAWMDLALFTQLFRHGNTAALPALERYLAEPRPLEPYFLRHPMGQAAITFLLRHACPTLLQTPENAPLVRLLCARLRASRCRTPLLDSLENSLAAG